MFGELVEMFRKFQTKTGIKNLMNANGAIDNRSIKAESDATNVNEQLLQEKLSIELENTKNELYEGKCVIAGQIDRLKGRDDIDLGNYRLVELINMVTTSMAKLKENEHHAIKENCLKIQCVSDGLRKENERLNISTLKYKIRLADEKKKNVAGVKLIEELKWNAINQKQNEILLNNEYKQAIFQIRNLTGVINIYLLVYLNL